MRHGALQLYGEIWELSHDHRTIVFNNQTDCWIELKGDFYIGPSIAESKLKTTSKVLLPPHEVFDWNFLGESMDYTMRAFPQEILLDLPDSYSLAVRHNFHWQVSVCHPVEPATHLTQSRKSDEKNSLKPIVMHKTAKLLVQQCDCCKTTQTASLELKDLPLLQPTEKYEVHISAQEKKQTFLGDIKSPLTVVRKIKGELNPNQGITVCDHYQCTGPSSLQNLCALAVLRTGLSKKSVQELELPHRIRTQMMKFLQATETSNIV